jgi:hypothetical protein
MSKATDMLSKANRLTEGLDLEKDKFFLDIEKHLAMLHRIELQWWKELNARFPPRPGYCWSLQEGKLVQDYWGTDEKD